MSYRFDCRDPAARGHALDAAATAVSADELVVLPTEAIYGVGCAAFSARGGERLMRARGGGRDRPVPVLLPQTSAADRIAELGGAARDLAEAFWPGGLTLVCPVLPEMAWAFWAVRGVVSVRVPLQPVALELMDRTGPLAVTGATPLDGIPATDCEDARRTLGDQVAAYLDVGALAAAEVSTIVEVGADEVRVLRHGAIPVADLAEAIGKDRIGLATSEATGR